MNDPIIRSRIYKPTTKKPLHKRWYTYAIAVIVFVVAYSIVNFGLAYNEIFVDNRNPANEKTFWEGFAGIFGVNNDEPDEPFVDPNPMPEPEASRLDVLILGMRGEDGEDSTGKWLTDTMILASLNKRTGKTALLSIPRDLYVDMVVPEFEDGYRARGKINEMYVDGLSEGGGLLLAKQVASKMTGVHVDNAVIFDFLAFQEIVDSLDGIDIYLDQPFIEEKQWGYPFELEAGENHLDGQTALYYTRSRFSTSDFDRARRQAQVIKAIKEKAISLGFLANPIKVNSLISNLKGNIRMDIQPWQIKDMLSLSSSFGDGSIKHTVLSPLNVLRESQTLSGGYILLPIEDDYESLKSLAQGILD